MALPASTVRSDTRELTPSLTGVDMSMDRKRFSNASKLLRQGHGAILPGAGSSARAATVEHA
jgi:hypothetical protein